MAERRLMHSLKRWAASAIKALASFPSSAVSGGTRGTGRRPSTALPRGSAGLIAPGARLDYEREAGDLWRNSVVAVALGWLADNFPQARPVVRDADPDDDGADGDPVPGHPLIELLKRPNPHYTARALWQATLLSYKVDGNAYWAIVRGSGGYGAPVELWYVPHWMIWPRWDPRDKTAFIGWYDYQVDGTTYRLDPADVVHFKDGIDPYNTRLGLARLKNAERSVAGLNSGEGYTASILRNCGVVSVVWTPEAGNIDEADEPTVLKLVERFQAGGSGENAGRSFGTTLAMKATQLGMGPQELALDTILDRPEATVLAMLGLSAQALGMNAGRASSTFSNVKEAKASAWEEGLIPVMGAFADVITHRLLPDFDTTPGRSFGFDTRKVPALKQDVAEMVACAATAYSAGLLPQNRALELADLNPVDGGDDRYAPGHGDQAAVEGPIKPADEPTTDEATADES